uniref:Uncharacterized protein n=1 Tax=Kalanchoe fedtschenkoi TaxID=63787 RepID=A0A7N0TN48_KALFE
MLVHELWFQQILIEAAKFMAQRGEIHYYWNWFHAARKLIHFSEEYGQAFLQLGFLYLALIHLPDLINTIGVVSSASAIYSDEKPVKLKETLFKSFERVTFKRSLVTSIYIRLLASMVLIGLLAIASQGYLFSLHGQMTWFSSIYGLLFICLLYKYMQWSSLWNLGLVTAILEEKHGDIALGVSALYSRGNRQHGEVVMAIFIVWKLSLRLMAATYVAFHEGDRRRVVIVTAVQVFLVCIGNVIKWVTFVIFYYDCKRRFLEKILCDCFSLYSSLGFLQLQVLQGLEHLQAWSKEHLMPSISPQPSPPASVSTWEYSIMNIRVKVTMDFVINRNACLPVVDETRHLAMTVNIYQQKCFVTWSKKFYELDLKVTLKLCMGRSSNIRRSQTARQAALLTTMYSASAVERAKTCCFFEDHEITSSPR